MSIYKTHPQPLDRLLVPLDRCQEFIDFLGQNPGWIDVVGYKRDGSDMVVTCRIKGGFEGLAVAE